MNISFYLHSSQDRKGKNYIFCQYTHGGDKWRMSTGIKIHPRDWNKKKGQPKGNYPHVDALNKALKAIEEKIEAIALGIKAELRTPDPELVKEIYLEKDRGKTVGEAWSEFELEHLSHLAFNTRKRYTTTKNNLAYFKPKWRDFGPDWGNRFRTHLTKKGNNKSTANKKISDIKTFLKFCRKKGWLKTDHFTTWETPIDRKTEQIYLTLEEIDKIRQYKFDSERLQKAKTLFLFHCVTGLRYGDGQLIKPENIDFNKSSIALISEKTQKPVFKPVCLEALEILHKGLPTLSNQKFNKYLKEICKTAGIIERVAYKGEFREKWELVTTHTARRSFITNLLNKGAPPHLVGRLVDHSDLKTTSRYDHSGFAEQQELLDNFFR